ncbi:MAG: pilus assembly protein TadG-related protein [Parvularculaceae bacterium]
MSETIKGRRMGFRRFCADQTGATAVAFAFLILFLLISTGIAVDFAQSNRVQAKLQDAADAAVIAAVRAKLANPGLSSDQVETIANDIFTSYAGGEATLSNIQFRPIPGTDKFELTADASLAASFLSAAGWSAINRAVASEATLTPSGPVEVVMALDNSGSMDDNGKLAQLRDAANLLVTEITSKGSGIHQIGLVPFAEYVSVGTLNAGQSWVSSTLYEENGDTATGSWDGCVGSRDSPLDIQDLGFTSDPAPRIKVSTTDGCPRPIQPLTTNVATITSQINAMSPDGSTYIPAGLMWALRTISNAAPFTEGRTTADVAALDGVKAVVLLTDGQNRRVPAYPGHIDFDSDGVPNSVTIANALTTDACNAVKTADVRLYTIAFQVSDSTTRDLLESCASDDGGYYNAGDDVALQNAFASIANDIIRISISR